MDIKAVISHKGKSIQKEIKEADAKRFIGKKIGESVKGELLDLTGYEFTITGGSDYAGFPMRQDLPGVGRKRILAVGGIGIHNNEKGVKRRKAVAGNQIYAQTAQINLKVTKEGKDSIFPVTEAKEEPKKEEAKE